MAKREVNNNCAKKDEEIWSLSLTKKVRNRTPGREYHNISKEAIYLFIRLHDMIIVLDVIHMSSAFSILISKLQTYAKFNVFKNPAIIKAH